MPPMTPPVPAPPAAPGTTAPATTPPKNAGMKSQAAVVADAVAKAVNKMLGMLDPMSDEAKDARKILDIVTKRWGPVSQDLNRMQAKSFMAQAPPIQGGPQQNAAAKLGQMGLSPGGPPTPQPADAAAGG